MDESTILDLLQGQPDGKDTDHICLVIDPTDLNELAKQTDLDVVEGPVQRGGARGQGWSLYVLDPDGHLIELKQYTTDPSGTSSPTATRNP